MRTDVKCWMGVLLVLAIAFIPMGCYTYNQGTVQSNVVLTPSTYKVIKTVQGTAWTGYFLGIAGFKGKDQVCSRARKNLQDKNPLGPNQEYANYTTDIRTTNGLFVYTSVVVTVTADIVEFTNSNPTAQ